jgi:hypothetical protein
VSNRAKTTDPFAARSILLQIIVVIRLERQVVRVCNADKIVQSTACRNDLTLHVEVILAWLLDYLESLLEDTKNPLDNIAKRRMA